MATFHNVNRPSYTGNDCSRVECVTPARMHAFRVPRAVNVVHFWCADPLRRPTMPTPLLSEQAGCEDNLLYLSDRLLIATPGGGGWGSPAVEVEKQDA